MKQFIRLQANSQMEIKDRIAVRAGELFMEHGVRSVSMDEIASKLGMSKRTIYQHFPDKEEILIYFLDYYEQHRLESLEKLFETLPTVVDIFLHVMDKHREMAMAYNIKFQEDIEKYFPRAQEKTNEQRERSVVLTKEFLKKGIEQGVIRNDLNFEVTAFLLQNMSNTYMNALRMATRTFSIWELFFTMTISFVRGISTEKGIKIVDDYLKKQK
jgi:AcrR family transcriptional regulator